jgi:molybdopterin/thiamine biosynthesis adenylyltransferase
MIISGYMHAEIHAISITVIGCGGTGTVLLQELARINRSLISQGKKGLIVTCIDDDVVSDANFGRSLSRKT